MIRLQCQSCNKMYKISGDIPFRQEAAFTCPACRGLMDLGLLSKKEAEKHRPQFNLKPKKTGSNHHSLEEPPPKEPLAGEALKRKIFRTVSDLPPMLPVVKVAQRVMDNPRTSFNQIARVLETDMAISARVLRLANSVYFGVGGQISSILHASVLLGCQTLEELITSAGHIIPLGKSLSGYRLASRDLWRHSLAVGHGARLIAKKIRPELENDAYVSGVLHDAGKLILNPYVLKRRKEFSEFMENSKKTYLSAETRLFGFNHSDIASELFRSWNIPSHLTTAIRYHHYPSRSHGNELSNILHISDCIAKMGGVGMGLDDMRYHVDQRAMRFLGLIDDDIREIMSEVVESVSKIAEEMQIV